MVVKKIGRKDPYKNFKFRISLDGKPVLGVSKVSAIKRTTEVIKHRDGNDLHVIQNLQDAPLMIL
jgi:phage tail-like protein